MLKKSQKSGRQEGICFMWKVLILAVVSLIAVQANAAIVYDDFEDGDLNLGTKWYLGGTGTGKSTADVVDLNSKEGHLRQVGASTPGNVGTAVWGDVSISQTFDYTPGLHFDFTMAASAVSNFNAKARAGVEFQFLNVLGTRIDSIGMMYATYSLPSDYATIADTAHHSYSFNAEDLMGVAGMTSSEMAQVTSIFMKFEASSQRYMHAGPVYDATSQVWFDNVNVTPEPATIILLGVGGLMLRKRRA